MNFFNLVNLLSEETPETGAGAGAGAGAGNNWLMPVLLGVIVVAFVVMFIMNNRKQKKQKEEQQNTLNAIRPGNKVKTIGGVCGIIVEVNHEENTFVLETGSEAAGKSYMKFDMAAIYQTDAKPEPKVEEKKAAPVEVKEEVKEVAPVEEKKEDKPVASKKTTTKKTTSTAKKTVKKAEKPAEEKKED